MNGAMVSPSAEDALVQVHKTMEPSMEEILASIRSLIAEDGEAPALAAAPEPELVIETIKSAEPLVDEPVAEPDPVMPRVVWSRPQSAGPAAFPRPITAPEPIQRLAIEPPTEPDMGPEPLLSPDADDAAASSFAALNAALELQSSDLAERMVGELLRPMLKTWLDENLPSIVEKLVRAEIQRVARGRG